jgi:hypothetical protein
MVGTRIAAHELDYESYLVGRLRQALQLAEAASSERERAIHLRSCRYYCDLLDKVEVPSPIR